MTLKVKDRIEYGNRPWRWCLKRGGSWIHRTVCEIQKRCPACKYKKMSQSPRSGAGILTQYHKEKEKSSNKTCQLE